MVLTLALNSNLIDCTSHILKTVAYKTTTILLEGKRVKLQLWDTSGQGRFCTIIRSYSRGAQGIILVYDITNKWSFDGIDRWLKEVDEVSSQVSPSFRYSFIYYLVFEACPWYSESLGGQPPALGIQAPGGGQTGRDLRQSEQHVLLRDIAAMRLQYTRVLLRAGAHGAAQERHGAYLA